MKIKIFLFVVLGFLSLAAVAQKKEIRTIEADIFLMTELPGRYNYRALTQGYDSQPKSWGVDIGRNHFSAKPYINYRNQSGKHFKVETELQPFQLNRLTICFDDAKATMYMNGKKIGEITDVLDYPGNSVYVVGKDEYLIPAVKEFILSTDLEKNEMHVKLIEGMRTNEN